MGILFKLIICFGVGMFGLIVAGIVDLTSFSLQNLDSETFKQIISDMKEAAIYIYEHAVMYIKQFMEYTRNIK